MRKSAILAFAVGLLGANALFSSTHASTIAGFGDPIDAAELAGGTVINFDSLTPGLFSSIHTGGVTFTGVGAPFDIGSDYIGSYNTRGAQSLYNNFDFQPDAFEFAFDIPVSAFAFNWGASNNIWDLTALDSSDNVLETFALHTVTASNAGDYFGIAAAGIARATLVDRLDNALCGDYVFIDNFTYNGNVTATPLPGTVWLMLAGLASLGVLYRIRATKQPAAFS